MVTSLKLGFQLYSKLGKIDKVPASKPPTAFFPRFVLEAGDEMNRIIAHFVGRNFWLEIKCAKAAVAAADRVKFRIEIKNAFARKIDNSQIGITGTHHAPLRRAREIAIQSCCRIE